MKAIVHKGKRGIEGLRYEDVSDKSPGYSEVKVKLKAAGLNHRDLFIINNRNEEDPVLILGSDGAGIIEEIGEGVTSVTVNTEVIINPSIDWEFANNLPTVPEVLGGPSDGTFSNYVIISAENVVKSLLIFHGKKQGYYHYQH